MRKTLLVSFLVFLVGCEGQQAENVMRIQDAQKIELRVAYLPDGTRCAILSGFSGGLSCDWRGPKRTPPPTSEPSHSE